MSSGGPAVPADDSVRDSDNSHSPVITPLLRADLSKLNPEIARKVRDVVDRKGKTP